MFNKILPHLVAVATFIILSIAFFSPQLQGKVIRQSDIVQNKAMAQEHRSLQKELGERILWTNAMFGGMPTYQITTVSEGNLLKYVNQTFKMGFSKPIALFLTGMLCFYILMISLNINPWIGIVGAVAFGFTTNNFVLYEAGHVTKIQTIAFIPLIAAGVINAFRKKYLLGGLLFALGIGLNILANHVQMTYYFAMTLLIFGIAQLIFDARAGKIMEFAKAAGILIVAGLIGVGANSSNLMTTYEYSQDTMRGKPILEQTTANANPQSSSETDGLARDYAMNWSNGTLDLFSTFIPRAVGGSSGEALGSESATYKALKRNGANVGARTPLPLYFGDLPFTSGPPYFGAIIIFLFILGLLLIKGPVKWWLGLGVLLTFMLSMGKNLGWFNFFLFDHFPLFNKFRTPNSVLSVTAAMMPILGMLALSQIAKRKGDTQNVLQKLYIATGITAGIALIFALFASSFMDFSSASDARYESILNTLKEDRASLMRSDAFRSLGLVLVAAALIWAYIKEKLQFTWIAVALGVLILGDLWMVDRRYVAKEDFVTQRNYDNAFQPRPVDQQILQQEQSRGAYRVFDLTVGNPFESASASYHHNTVGGYHPAKLQRIQDIVDRHFSQRFNQDVLNMFNTKYFITNGQNGQPQVQQNPAALGNAWFIDTIKMVANANAEIDALNDFNAKTQVVVNQEFSDYINAFDPNGNGTITADLSNYRPDHLIYQTNSDSEQLAVFSEVWYGPDKGWNAYIDGEKVDHIRANYILRALKIPAGQHKVEFIFEPSSYATGKTISFLCSLLILLGLGGFIVYYLPKQLNEMKSEEAIVEEEMPKTTKQAAPKVKTKKRKKK